MTLIPGQFGMGDNGRYGWAKECVHCGRVWVPTRSDAQTCSDRCRKARQRAELAALNPRVPVRRLRSFDRRGRGRA